MLHEPTFGGALHAYVSAKWLRYNSDYGFKLRVTIVAVLWSAHAHQFLVEALQQ
jgi:hypothetical protein